jgi:ribose 5-phosphate isomerase A
MTSRAGERKRLKRIAAEAAVALVEDGMIVGLGSGSTSALAIEALARRVARGLRIRGVPTSKETALLARRLGLALTGFARHRHIDLTIDGADEVQRGSLNLVKGLGGALLREKIVAKASRRMIVIVDDGKLVDRLGIRMPLPVEIVPFGWQLVVERLVELGAEVRLRRRESRPFRTDNGNYIADCDFGGIAAPAALEQRLAAITGVVETGLFIGLASEVIVGSPSGAQSLPGPTGWQL